jgi:hypothetical protein
MVVARCGCLKVPSVLLMLPIRGSATHFGREARFATCFLMFAFTLCLAVATSCRNTASRWLGSVVSLRLYRRAYVCESSDIKIQTRTDTSVA